MVLGGGWAWLAASCGGSWPGHSDAVVIATGDWIACVVRRAATALVRAASRVSVPCATAL